ncbi:MAG: glycoside hydrolase family 88 protein [Bacteroidales bacterium]|nr:glycoside hydrolase family 88 protein [Bacteroidales bacterium]
MKHSIIIAVSSLLLLSCSVPRESMKSLGDRVFTLADSQFKILDSKLDADRFPRTVENGRLLDAPISWWCSGFFPGSLAYTYAYTQDPEMLQLAVKNTQKLDSLFCGRYKTSHDVGFMTVCSYGKLYELGICDTIPAMLGLAADKLASRFSPVTGTTRSWDFGKWKWPVIIDNMMNLELLMEYGTPEQQKMAMSHADRTIENHFRGDFTTWHVVDYSRKDGSVRRKQTHQGLNDDSAWARGQAWALYGYTMMSREASKKGYPEAAERYLSQARSVALMLLDRLPSDGIPAWDFDAPEPALRDASAAAVMASAFVELSGLLPERGLSRRCLKMARTQISTLASSLYLAEPGEIGGFLLKHSVGNMPGGGEVDVPLTYADYYFLEAVYRYNRI